MRLKRKENATSTSHDGTIHSSCLMTCTVDCVTTRPQDFEEFQLHVRSHHAGPKGFVKTECMESVQESDSRGRRK